MSEPRSVGLVHDYLLVKRGAERTFCEMAALLAGGALYTLLYDRDVFGMDLAGRSVTVSGLRRLHSVRPGFRRLLPLFPSAVERLPVARHDLVVSSSSAFAHGVHPGPGRRACLLLPLALPLRLVRARPRAREVPKAMRGASPSRSRQYGDGTGAPPSESPTTSRTRSSPVIGSTTPMVATPPSCTLPSGSSASRSASRRTSSSSSRARAAQARGHSARRRGEGRPAR